MSKKKSPPKMKRFEDLKKNSKARCINLMYVIYKEQMKEGYSDDEAHARVAELLKSRGILFRRMWHRDMIIRKIIFLSD